MTMTERIRSFFHCSETNFLPSARPYYCVHFRASICVSQRHFQISERSFEHSLDGSAPNSICQPSSYFCFERRCHKQLVKNESGKEISFCIVQMHCTRVCMSVHSGEKVPFGILPSHLLMDIYPHARTIIWYLAFWEKKAFRRNEMYYDSFSLLLQ